MSSNIDHEALIEQQISDDKKVEAALQQRIDKELKEEREKDSYFVRKLDNNVQDNSQKQYQINSRSNIEVIQSGKPYTFEEIRDFKIPELQEKRARISEEDVAEYLKEKSKDNTDNIRYDSIYMEALKYGAQSGLYYRAGELNKFIENYQAEFSKIFNFTPLLLANGKVVPPVIVESKNNVQNQSSYTLRMTDRSYKIDQQVRVVSNPLTWREYLRLEGTTPVLPDDMLLPLNPKEDHFWKMGVAKGWETGVSQANSIYLENVRKLERDYIGMIRYHLMYKRGLVNSPVTSTVKLGVTGTEEDMNVNEVIFNIDKAASFNKNSETWRALPELPDFITPDPFAENNNW